MKYEFRPEAEQELYEAASRCETEIPALGSTAPMKLNA